MIKNLNDSQCKNICMVLLVLALHASPYTCWFINSERHRNDLAFGKNPADIAFNSDNNNNINNNNNNNINKFNFKPVFSYVGCYNDRRDSRDIGETDFSYITKFNKSIPTVELCVHLCAKEGYTVAGIQAL